MISSVIELYPFQHYNLLFSRICLQITTLSMQTHHCLFPIQPLPFLIHSTTAKNPWHKTNNNDPFQKLILFHYGARATSGFHCLWCECDASPTDLAVLNGENVYIERKARSKEETSKMGKQTKPYHHPTKCQCKICCGRFRRRREKMCCLVHHHVAEYIVWFGEDAWGFIGSFAVAEYVSVDSVRGFEYTYLYSLVVYKNVWIVLHSVVGVE